KYSLDLEIPSAPNYSTGREAELRIGAPPPPGHGAHIAAEFSKLRRWKPAVLSGLCQEGLTGRTPSGSYFQLGLCLLIWHSRLAITRPLMKRFELRATRNTGIRRNGNL